MLITSTIANEREKHNYKKRKFKNLVYIQILNENISKKKEEKTFHFYFIPGFMYIYPKFSLGLPQVKVLTNNQSFLPSNTFL